MGRRNPLPRLLARAARLDAATDAPLPAGGLLRPHRHSRVFTFAHYNVVIPDLPEPHRFLACMVMIGQTGIRAFDVDHALVDGPRHTVTLASGTAATAPDWFGSYSERRQCRFAEDGSYLAVGDELEIVGSYPDYRVRLDRPGFQVRLDLSCTGLVTWFARSAMYDHLALPARYRGEITWQGETLAIDGLCSLEHARVARPAAVASHTRPRRFKLPGDFFTYQVLRPAPDTLLAFARVTMMGEPMLCAGYLNEVGGEQRRYLTGVRLTVDRFADEPLVAADGTPMPVPAQWRWSVDDGRELELIATADSEWIYGIGSGWISGFRYSGHVRGRAAEGRGYVEWVDRRRDAGTWPSA